MTIHAIEQSPLTPDLVRRLATESNDLCATIFLPPHRPGTSANPKTVLRAMTQRIGQQLRDQGLRGLTVEDYLRPLVDLAAQPEFEHGHGDAWALFRSPTDVYFIRAAGDWPEAGAVGKRFFLLPALEFLARQREAYLLAITSKGVRLYRLRDGVLASAPLPAAVPAAFDSDRMRNAAEHAANRSGSVHFGVADVPDRAARVYRDYFAEVARGLAPLFERDQLPVILAGTRETLNAYRDASRDPHLLAEGLTLSPDGGFPLEELEARMMSILTGTPREAEDRARERIRAAGPAKWVSEEVEAVKAATEGRVATLFVEAGRPLTSSDLANQAAVETIAHGGEVWVVPSHRMPAATGLLAELRFVR